MSDFLTSEAISNYIVFILGTIFGVVGWLFVRWVTRKRPRVIKVVRMSESSLLEVDSEVKEDITISYQGEPVESLYRTEFVVRNASSQTIDGVEIALNFQAAGVIDVNVEDALAERETTAKILDTSEGIRIALPFINSENLYEDEVKVKVFSLKPIVVEDIAGGGREWKVEFVDRQRIITELADELIDELSVYSPVAMVLGLWTNGLRADSQKCAFGNEKPAFLSTNGQS